MLYIFYQMAGDEIDDHALGSPIHMIAGKHNDLKGNQKN